MPLIRVRTYLGKKLLGEPTRPYAAEITVKAVVVDRARLQIHIYLERPLCMSVARGALESSGQRCGLWAGGKAPAQAHSCVLA